MSGTGGGRPYSLDGEFWGIQPDRRLVHTWTSGDAGPVSRVTYLLDPIPAGTHLTIRHQGFPSPGSCIRTPMGWATSLRALAKLLRSP